MGSAAIRRNPSCPACTGPTRATALCRECAEAFALARRANAMDGRVISVRPNDVEEGEDADLWGFWALLGDVGGLPLRFYPD